jgi:acetyl esterase/lipase
MPLDPHIRRILDMLAAASAADASRLTLGERRDAFRKLMSLSESNVAVGHVEDRALPGPDGPISVRIYTPIDTRSDKLPGLVYFHGGGLVAGSLDTHEGICRPLANAIGCRLVSVDYRLAPEHKFPAAIMDGYVATLWAVEHAAELRIDRDRIAVGGDSAGGTLAAVVCQLARQARGVRLAAQLLLCPITDFAADTESRCAFAEGYLLHKATLDGDVEHYVPAGLNPADPCVSPLRAADFSGLPPAYIHTAEFDPVRDEGRAYADRLAQAGVEVSYTCHPGMTHLFYGMTSVVPYARNAMQHIGAEIRAAFDGAQRHAG